jgi:hypothetical protein
MWYDFGKKLEKFMIILHKDVYFWKDFLHMTYF